MRYSIAGFVLIIGGIGLLMGLSPDGAQDSTLRLAAIISFSLTTIPVAYLTTKVHLGTMWWSKQASIRGFNTLFVAYCNIGIATVLFALQNERVAMHGTALFAVVGVYVAQFATRRILIGHILVSSALICALALRAYLGGCALTTVIAATLVSLIAANGTVALLSKFTKQFQHTLATQHRMANTDSLTGLLNRRGFSYWANVLLSESTGHFSVAVIDIDHFKQINDRHGHAVGDALLNRVSATIQHTAGVSVVAARLGGDEFAIAAPLPPHEIVELAERIRLFSSGLINGDNVSMSVGIGVTPVRTRLHNTEAIRSLVDQTLSVADRALISAKTAGRDTILLVDMATGKTYQPNMPPPPPPTDTKAPIPNSDDGPTPIRLHG